MLLANRSLSTISTQAQYESLWVCMAMYHSNCSQAEYRRFLYLQTWAFNFPMLKYKGSSLSSYLDGIYTKMKSYKPKYSLGYLYFSRTGNSYARRMITSKNDSWFGFQTNQTNLSFTAFNSSQLVIKFEIQKKIDSEYMLSSWLNMTFILPEGSSPATLTLNCNLLNLTSIKNG